MSERENREQIPTFRGIRTRKTAGEIADPLGLLDLDGACLLIDGQDTQILTVPDIIGPDGELDFEKMYLVNSDWAAKVKEWYKNEYGPWVGVNKRLRERELSGKVPHGRESRNNNPIRRKRGPGRYSN